MRGFSLWLLKFVFLHRFCKNQDYQLPHAKCMVYVGYLQALRRYLYFSVGKSPAKTLSLFVLTKWIKSIFPANQKTAFLRILQIGAQWLTNKRTYITGRVKKVDISKYSFLFSLDSFIYERKGRSNLPQDESSECEMNDNDEPLDQSINQPINQSINQLMNQCNSRRNSNCKIYK